MSPASPSPSAPPRRDELAAVASASAVLVLGTFDGVHSGHRALIAHAVGVARALQRPWLPVAFFPPPKTVLGGYAFLSSAREKHELLAEAGAAAGLAPAEIVIIGFDADVAATPAESFAEQLAALRPSAIVIGEDFRFGRARRGDIAMLRACCERLEVVPLVAIGDEVVKSSAIRDALEGGDVERAAALLGAPYRIVGEVVEGDRRGRTIGVPTANLELDPRKSLPHGVFAVSAQLPDGSRYGAMANLGPRPSFPGPSARVEAHLFDFDGDLYGATLRIELLARLRGQRRFDGLDDLRRQLAEDAAAARARLATLGV